MKEKVSPKFFNSRWFWLLIVLIAIGPFLFFATILGYQYIFLLPKAKEARSQLEMEFNTIAPLPEAKIVKSYSNNKMNQALVGADYLSEAGFTEIFNYYDQQLKEHGWQFQSVKGLTDWGNDLGGKTADYCKGDYAAELAYSGQPASYGWTYAFSFDWGLNDCKSMTLESTVK